MFNLVVHNNEIRSELNRMIRDNKGIVKEAQNGEECFSDSRG